jgi:hypothetical protein
MRPTDSELIASLTQSLEPTPAFRRPKPILALWISACSVYLAILIWRSTGHYPLIFGPHSWPSIFSWILLAAAFVCSSAGTIASGVPGRTSVRSWLVASWALIGAWAVWLVVRHYIEPSSFGFELRIPHHGDIKCAYETFFWGVGPMAALYGVLRGMATVQPSRAGSLWMLAAFSASAFLIEIMCDDESVLHQLYGHWLLVALFGYAGFRAGRSLLRW